MKLLRFIEKASIYLQGKGWGSHTVKKEFLSAVSLLPNKLPNICIDIGGHEGLYSEQILNKFPNCVIIVFEPSQVNYSKLIKKYHSKKNIVIENYAVYSQEGSHLLYSDREGSGLSSLTKRRMDHFGINFDFVEEIKTVTFYNYWKKKLHSKVIDILKIDIEGNELDALQGLGEAIYSIKVIQFEFGGCNIDTRTYFQDFFYFFQKKNYEIYRISLFGLIKIDKYTEFEETFVTTNFLAKNNKFKDE